MFIFLQRLLPKHLLSRLVGYVANSDNKWIKSTFIRLIIRKYDVDMTEAREQDAQAYRTFNHFFTRALKDGARPISGKICSPADGTISALGAINGNQIMQAKGINYSLDMLLARPESGDYARGSFITIYLAPRDYHRVHCPQNASLYNSRYVPGELFSVNETTTQGLQDLFVDNERLVMEFDTDTGKMAVIMIGAMIVAAIQPVWREQPYRANNVNEESFSPATDFKIGAELGQFRMGSTAIVLLQNRVDWSVKPNEQIKLGQPII